MRHLTLPALIIGMFFALTSCSNKQYQTLFEQKNAINDSLAKNSITDFSYYRIKPQDILQVKNLQSSKSIVDDAPVSVGIAGGNAATGQTYQVEEDGTVALPVIGRVPVVGLTRHEAEKTIEGIYRAKLLKDPIIEVIITNLKVTLLGEVHAQGNYPLVKDKTTLVDIIGAAGGLTDKANEKNIKIIHGTDKNAKVTIIDLNNIQSIYDTNSILQNGDIVYIAQNKRAVRVDNLQNFSLIVQPALIIFNAVLIIITLSRR